MSKIVISYRRDDAEGHAGRLYDALFRHFGKDEVLRDLDSIPYGVDFEQHLNEEIETCRALLVVIGPHWLEMKDEKGRRRLDHPQDWVTMEVEAALKRDIPVIPVTVSGAPMPERSELPPRIADLAKRQRCELSAAHWNAEVDHLIEGLDRSIEGSSRKQLIEIEPPQPSAVGNASLASRRRGIALLFLLLAVMGGVAGYLFLKGDSQTNRESPPAGLEDQTDPEGQSNTKEEPPTGGTGAKLSPVSVSASSSASSSADACGNSTTFLPQNVIDDNPESAWRTEGDGLGESLRFDFGAEVYLGRIGLIPGYAKVDPCDGTDRFQENRVIERVVFTFDDGSTRTATYGRVPRLQWTNVSKTTSSVIVEIMKTSLPEDRDYTAISEVEFFDDEAS